MTPDVRQQPIEIEIPAERKWTLAVTDDVGFADIWEKGYTDEDSILTITVIPRTRPTPAAPTSESEAEDSFRIYRSEWQSLESMLDECGCDDGKRILYQILTEERDLEHLDAAVATKARECLMKDAKCKKLYFTCRVPDLETLKEGIDRLSQPWSIDVLREIEIIRREHDTAIATQSREEVLKTILLQILEEIRNGCILSTKSGGEYYNVSKEWIDDKIESLRTGGGK